MSVREQEENHQRVLVCAPSNAAIDEILKRITEKGVYGDDGELYRPPVVRLGPNSHPSLKEYTLKEQMDAKIKARAQVGNTAMSSAAEIKQEILRDASIVCATLSVAGSRDLIDFHGEFDTVVIDEAGQAVELSTIIPLQLGCRRLILVGDPKQLPATVFANSSTFFKYDRSLFERLQESNKHTIHVLAMQYRMHPDISSFPSKFFYDEKLKDGENIMSLVGENAWSKMPVFQPVSFFNVPGNEEEHNKSLRNHDEADFIIKMYGALTALFPQEDWSRKVGVISPYQAQVSLIKNKFKLFFGTDTCPVDVNTVDGFQGREKDCIFVSTVRGGKGKSIGFVKDKRRMNVSLTRPRLNLWVVGNAKRLQTNLLWKAFVSEQIEYHNNNKKGSVGVSRYFKITRPVDNWMHRWLVRYYETHPTEEYPKIDFLKNVVPKPLEMFEEEQAPKGFGVTKEEMDKLMAEAKDSKLMMADQSRRIADYDQNPDDEFVDAVEEPDTEDL